MSSFVKQHLPILLVDHLTSGCHPQAALSHGFLEVDARLGASFIDCEFSGSTCVVAYLKVRTACGVGWGGVSRRAVLYRAVLCSRVVFSTHVHVWQTAFSAIVCARVVIYLACCKLQGTLQSCRLSIGGSKGSVWGPRSGTPPKP